ncbi:MAG: DUF4269 domain-containing protein [Geminicoccaceae bacterium]
MTTRPHFQKVVDDLNRLGCLAEFSPVVIGTPPLGLAIEESDIDIACSALDLEKFGDTARKHFGQFKTFSLRRFIESDEPAIVATFLNSGWKIELFCQALDVEKQAGVRNFFCIEQRLLRLEPGLRPEILRLKRGGLKTEPAFAKLLMLQGAPYEPMLALEAKTDGDLRALTINRARARYRPYRAMTV